MPSLEIVLATYNGERYLSEQLDSLFAQTYQDFRILAADDASTDATPFILADYQRRYPGRIEVLDFDEAADGACANFARLVARVTADYVMFCDHDDVWLPNKIALSLERMHSAEASFEIATPILVHTDLIVAGPNLEHLHSSFWRYTKIDSARNTLGSLLLRNTVVGCTALLNRALYERARPIPPQAVMHDYWCALVAATLGKLDYIEESTILYRQHENNRIGAKAWNMSNILQHACKTVLTRQTVSRLALRSLQAKTLLTRYEDAMTAEQRETTAIMANLWSLHRYARFWSMLRKGLTMGNFLQNMAVLVTVSTRDAN